MTAPVLTPEARAADRPCELYRYHAPVPSRTQGHHRRPVYLQNRVYGRIRPAVTVRWGMSTSGTMTPQRVQYW